LNITII